MQQIPHLHLFLYTPSCKVAHPFPHFTKEIRASFGNASQNLLFMQGSKIWILCTWFLFWFFFFWSLCLRDSVIFAQCAPCVLRSSLDYGCHSFPSLCSLLACFKWACRKVLCSEILALFAKRWLEMQGVPSLMPGGAAGPWASSSLGVHEWPWSPSVATTSTRGMTVLGGGIPLCYKCAHMHVHRKAIHFMTFSMCWADLLSPGVVPLTLRA